MRSKGFTLIELLAVIVILAIIALIAVPIILGIIGDSKEQANKRSIDMYAEAIKIAIAKASITGEVPAGSYKPEAESKSIKLKDGDYTLPVDYDKSIVECETTELYKDGTIYLDECTVGGTKVEYAYGIKQEKEYKKYYENGEAVYFDVKLGTSCTNYVEANSATGYKGIETPTEANNNCLKFYAFLDDEESETLNLILDHNTTAKLAWVSKEDYNDDTNYGMFGNNNKGPLTLLKQLKTDTYGWTGVPELTTNDTYTPSKMYNNNEPYTINYNGYRARIISKEEISNMIGRDNGYFDVNCVGMYADGDGVYDTGICSAGENQYAWLFTNTIDCEEWGCEKEVDEYPYGYWTVSADSSRSNRALYANFTGGLFTYSVDHYAAYGLRPVIKVSKSQLS